MTSAPPPNDATSDSPERPSTSPGCLWFMKLSGLAAMMLFLLPAFDVAKYFAFDAGRESAIIQRIAPDDEDGFHGVHPANEARKWVAIGSANSIAHPERDDIPLLTVIARNDPDTGLRIAAISQLGRELSHSAVNFMRPMELVQAKSTLADIAVKDPNESVRESAQNALGAIAQNGVVVRR